MALERRTWQNLSDPVATTERAESAALQETQRPREKGNITYTQKTTPVREGQAETFNVGLQLLKEPKWALAVRRITHTHGEGSGRPA